MRRLTPAERLANLDKNTRLDDIVTRTEWSQHIVEQAVFLYGTANDEFSCNDFRDLLPELGRGYLGAAINSLSNAAVIEHTDRMVPSTSPDTHAHRIAVWRLSAKGRAIARARYKLTEAAA